MACFAVKYFEDDKKSQLRKTPRLFKEGSSGQGYGRPDGGG